MNNKDRIEILASKYNKRLDSGNVSINSDMNGDKKEVSAYGAILRTANILNCLRNGINSISEIAGACKLNKSTVHRLLKTMNKARFTTRDPINRRYFIGPLITEMALDPYVSHEQLILCAINEMKELSRYSGETIGLGVLTGFYNVLVLEIPGTYDLRIVAKSKIISNLNAGASCKVLLSQLGNRGLKMLMKDMVLEPITKNTITSKEELLSQIKLVKQQDYAVDYCERIEGAINISVPIKGYLVPATLGILGPESRVRPRIPDYIDKLNESGKRIQENIREIFELRPATDDSLL